MGLTRELEALHGDLSRLIIRDVKLLSNMGPRDAQSIFILTHKLKDRDLEPLSSMGDLRQVNLPRADYLTDRAFDLLASIASLNWLKIYRSRISGESLTVTQTMEALGTLTLGNAQISDEGLSAIAALTPNLHDFDLQGNRRIQGDGLEALAALQGLEFLNLSGTRIKDRHLGFLACLPKLSRLWLRGTDVNGEGIVAFRDHEPIEIALPGISESMQQTIQAECPNVYLNRPILKPVVPEAVPENFSKGRQLILFRSTHCQPCDWLENSLASLPIELTAEITRVDVDRDWRLASSFNVKSVPTLVLLQDSIEKARLVGSHPADALMGLIATK